MYYQRDTLPHSSSQDGVCVQTPLMTASYSRNVECVATAVALVIPKTIYRDRVSDMSVSNARIETYGLL